MDHPSDDPMPHRLEPNEVARYARHLTLPEVGMEGQQRLRAASVLVVGAGGLGSPVAIYLAAAGVGCIGLVDFDAVDLSNLQRQVLYGSGDVGRLKLDPARRRIEELNPHVRVVAHKTRLDASNAFDLLRDYDVVIDGTDNFPTRYLVNDACVMLGKPNVYGSVFRFEGQVAVFWAERGPCYRCLYPDPPPPGAVPNCAEGGVLGVLPGIIGTLQATEAIKLIVGCGELLLGRLLLFDGLEMRFRELKLRKDPDCPVCSEHPRIRELADEQVACEAQAGAAVPGIDVVELQARLNGGAAPLLLDVRTRQEWEICRLEQALLLPIQELEQRLGELDPEAAIVVYCHSGMRSATAVDLLRRHGFRNVLDLRGGIDAWAARVDPSMPRY